MLKAYIYIALVIISGLVFAEICESDTYYMEPEGDFQNLREAFSTMRGGDTLIIKDGVYTGTENMIWSGMHPPNGSAEKYTVIKAENPGKVIFAGSTEQYLFSIQGPSQISSSMSYWQFEGIKWIGAAGFYGADHIKLLRCAFEGDVPGGNTVSFGTHSCHHVLLEDCIAYGKGRFKFLIYLSSDVVLRRCIARQDYANRNSTFPQPIASFSMYSSSNIEIQNCISIDGDQPKFWHDLPTSLEGSFNGPASAGPNKNYKWRGCISLNMAMGGSFDNASSDVIFEDCIFWHQTWGAGSKPSPGEIFRHCTIGDLRTADEMGLSANQTKKDPLVPGVGIGSHGTMNNELYTENNIITGAFYAGLWRVSTSNRNALWNNATNYLDVESIADDITHVDPFANSLKYLPRIEPGSDLSGKATDGGDIGANILKRIGKSGTLYGEPGYDEVTDEDLWPWPYEDWIKENMGDYNRGGIDPGLPRGDRGFAAYISPFGSPNTLTSYIWEYLGNQIPPEIYGSSSIDTTPPGIPDNMAAVAVSSKQIDLNWSASTDDVGVKGYKIYRDGRQIATTTNTSYSDTGLSPSTKYAYAVSAYDAAGNESRLSPASATTFDDVPGRPGKPVHIDIDTY